MKELTNEDKEKMIKFSLDMKEHYKHYTICTMKLDNCNDCNRLDIIFSILMGEFDNYSLRDLSLNKWKIKGSRQ